MFFSRIELDMERMETVRALAKPAVLHGAIEQSFKGERKRRLWRIDKFEDTCYLLVLSEDLPDFTALNKQFGDARENNSWETKSYAGLLERIDVNQKWRFRICANPVHSVKEQRASGRGKIFAYITTKKHQEKWPLDRVEKKWLLDRAEKNGFSLQTENFDVIRSEWVNFKKGTDQRRDITIYIAVFEGILTVTDAALFRKALIGGIGRAKAYGCGLLTIMRL